MLIPIRRISGRRVAEAALVLFTTLSAVGCNYSFRAAGGFPDHIRTMAILPFENSTTRFALTQEVYDQLLRDLPRALGVQSASEDVADAIVEGTIQSYNLTTPLFRPGQTEGTAEVLQRQVSVSVQVRIVDVVNNVVLWEGSSRGQGQYDESSETEDDGRLQALEVLVQEIVDGAQSNW